MNQPARLLEWFGRYEQVTVAYSGGVDSALVLAAAARALGPAAVHAITARSPALPMDAWSAAVALAAQLGVRHTAVETNELDSPGYRENGADRCYFCKSTLVDAITAISSVAVPGVIVTGTNADDVRDGWRPGISAAAERGARTPLADLGLSKDDVRAISRAWALPTWNQPASPCLSSRIAYGVTITAPKLARVDRAERALRLAAAGLDLFNLRVRDLGESVRVEVDADLVDAVSALPGLAALIAEAGFGDSPVAVSAFRSGALNAVLPTELRFARPA
jgi:pyridinium-3,5-biscarboxylic acid mononucleotide sulfurtransferase